MISMFIDFHPLGQCAYTIWSFSRRSQIDNLTCQDGREHQHCFTLCLTLKQVLFLVTLPLSLPFSSFSYFLSPYFPSYFLSLLISSCSIFPRAPYFLLLHISSCSLFPLSPYFLLILISSPLLYSHFLSYYSSFLYTFFLCCQCKRRSQVFLVEDGQVE
jgi:hypothetical protein